MCIYKRVMGILLLKSIHIVKIDKLLKSVANNDWKLKDI